GTSDPVEPVTSLDPLIATIDFARFGRAPARFDEAELALLNQKILHQTAYAAVESRLPAAIDEARWNAIRPNLMTVAEAAAWVRVFDGPFTPPVADAADRDVLVAAAAAAPGLDWAADPWHALTGAVKAATGAKGRALFLPLRRALTGLDHGPDMAELLPLIAKSEAVARLSAG
ncbi:MAG: glutamate--tRNA ligase, partial [Alphaproteobacteria bacterium HGW-Alphaproteobacteria-13]